MFALPALPHTRVSRARLVVALTLQRRWRTGERRVARVPPAPPSPPSLQRQHRWTDDEAWHAARRRCYPDVDPALYDALVEARRAALPEWLASYVCPDETLRAVAVARPATLDAMRHLLPEWHGDALTPALLAAVARHRLLHHHDQKNRRPVPLSPRPAAA